MWSVFLAFPSHPHLLLPTYCNVSSQSKNLIKLTQYDETKDIGSRGRATEQLQSQGTNKTNKVKQPALFYPSR